MANECRWPVAEVPGSSRANGLIGNGVAPRPERRDSRLLSTKGESLPSGKVFLYFKSYETLEIYTKMRIFIGLDDTDTIESPSGTGHLARMLMTELAEGEIVSYGVSRHQLLFDRRIPYTAKNSANVVHIFGNKQDISRLAEKAEQNHERSVPAGK